MPQEMQHPQLHRNPVSYFGGLLAAACLLMMALMLLANELVGLEHPYIGILIYMILPGGFGFGALLFLYGMRRESLRRRKLGESAPLPYPRVDLNDDTQRKHFTRVLFVGFLAAVLLAFVSYNAFIFTESVTFCGKLCHTVMAPEHTTYLNSPHARVACVHCHVGSGASFYVKSKLSGARQVIGVLTGRYPTPIPTPVENLRPARETCEECHWPQKFYGAQLHQLPHFRYDEQNTAEQVSILVKTGGGGGLGSGSSGIHYKMLLGNRIEYVTTDRRHQEIPWVKVTRPDGTVSEYTSLDYKGGKEKLAGLPRHKVECLTCHNRPTHHIPPADVAVDGAMNDRSIPRDLPWIKKVAVDALLQEYPDVASARRGIGQAIEGYYAKNDPDSAIRRADRIRQAVTTTTAIWERSVFPMMKVNWTTYPMNIGHRNWAACFRCHDGRHVDAKGKAITRDCTVCHTMPKRGPLMPLGASLESGDGNWHPFELKGRHARINCNKCHAAGKRVSTDCAGCHKFDQGAPMMGGACSQCHQKEQEIQPLVPCTKCHAKRGGLHNKGGHPDAACKDCHKPHAWVVKERATCLGCHEDKKEHNKEGVCPDCHEFK
ncbi:MAG TPA: NapC/NirT family cytochrome c [Candidatus Deferrimicrobiaceae bacterium]